VRYTLPLFVLCLLLHACGEKKHTAEGEKKELPQKDTTYTVYDTVHSLLVKRYAGMVGDKPALVDIKFTDGKPEAYGTAYYQGDVTAHMLAVQPGGDDKLTIVDFVDNSTAEDAKVDTIARWQVRLTADSIFGTCNNVAGGQPVPVALKADSARTYPLEHIGIEGFTRTTNQHHVAFSMSSSLSLIAPGASMEARDAAFLSRALLQHLDHDGKATSMRGYMNMRNKEILADNEPDTAETDTEAESRFAYDYDIMMLCEYCYDGLMVFGFYFNEYSGGAHPNHASSYLTVDMLNRRTLKLADMITADTAQISSLLNAAARKYFDLKGTDTLSENLLVDSVPPTDNVIISPMGITFAYSPYEIAAYVYGDVGLFLSYEQLKPYLKEEFKRRMHIE